MPLPDLSQISQSRELLLIRHAETDMTGRLCGQFDPPLNATGREQAGALALLLRTWNVRRLYSSDLLRALQTAQTLAKSWDVPITARSELREISFGDWEGRRWSEIRTAAPEMKALESSPDLCAPGGERFATFRCRILRALREALDETDEQLVAVVTHLGVMRVVLNEMISRDRPWELPQRIDHCSVYRIRAMGTTLKLLGELKIKA